MNMDIWYDFSGLICPTRPFSFQQRNVDSPAVDHRIYAPLMDACFIDAVSLFTNDQPHWLSLILIAIDD